MQGYGTVRFDKVETARKAIEEVINADLEGRSLGFKMDKYSWKFGATFHQGKAPECICGHGQMTKLASHFADELL